MKAILKTLALLALMLCASISADYNCKSKVKIYLSHVDNNQSGNYLSMKLGDGEIVNISEIRGDENGIYIYESDIEASNCPAMLQMTHKFLKSKNDELDKNAWMIEAKVIYYPCERCNRWREIGGKCAYDKCPSNDNMV